MRIKKPVIGILAFFIVLLTMPLGHAAMILMEKAFGHQYIYQAAIILGIVGASLLVWGVFSTNDNRATFLGLFAGLFIWTGWIEFAFVYFANRFGVEPLMSGGEIVTKPEYLIMPSSVGFWAIMMIYYSFGTKTGCRFFNWIQKKLRVSKNIEFNPPHKNVAMTTFMELIFLLWTFYLLLLFVYDENFIGEKHFVAYLVAFGSLLWSLYLFVKLIRISKMAYAIRYAIPTVIIFWNFVEILGRWGIFAEIWVEPAKYWFEMLITTIVFVILLIIFSLEKRRATHINSN